MGQRGYIHNNVEEESAVEVTGPLPSTLAWRSDSKHNIQRLPTNPCDETTRLCLGQVWRLCQHSGKRVPS